MAYPHWQQQPYQFPQYQPQAPQLQQTAPTQPSALLWVSGLAEAQAYPVAPNNAVALWDSSAPAIYLKQADASGRPTIKAYDLTEREAAPTASPPPANVNTSYATKDDLEALNGALDSLRREVEAMKRKGNKKAEVTEGE